MHDDVHAHHASPLAISLMPCLPSPCVSLRVTCPRAELAPRLGLHLRPHVGHGSWWAGAPLSGSSSAPPSASGSRWSALSAPSCPQIQQTVERASTPLRQRLYGRPERLLSRTRARGWVVGCHWSMS